MTYTLCDPGASSPVLNTARHHLFPKVFRREEKGDGIGWTGGEGKDLVKEILRPRFRFIYFHKGEVFVVVIFLLEFILCFTRGLWEWGLCGVFLFYCRRTHSEEIGVESHSGSGISSSRTMSPHSSSPSPHLNDK